MKLWIKRVCGELVQTYQSCLRIACPFRDSTLKLLVFAGMMKKTTTVTSFLWTCGVDEERRKGESRD